MNGVIHISEAANLALHTAALMASDPENPLTVSEAARTLPVSGHHLAKVLQRLARAGLLDSTRGPHGGFTLARPPSEITLLEIYEAVEGELSSGHCLLGKPVCEGGCVLGSFVRKTSLEFRQQLEHTRLSSLAGALTRKPSAQGPSAAVEQRRRRKPSQERSRR
jgi:Rrf2 family protein